MNWRSFSILGLAETWAVWVGCLNLLLLLIVRLTVLLLVITVLNVRWDLYRWSDRWLVEGKISLVLAFFNTYFEKLACTPWHFYAMQDYICSCYELLIPLTLSSKTDRSSSERAGRCHHMSPVYWSTGGNFLAAPENKHINIMNIKGKSGFLSALLVWQKCSWMWTVNIQVM